MPKIPANKKIEAFYDNLKKVIMDEIRKQDNGPDESLSHEEVLAVVSQMVGICIAFQDQRKHSADAIMRAVMKNIEEGNLQFIKIAFDGISNVPN